LYSMPEFSGFFNISRSSNLVIFHFPVIQKKHTAILNEFPLFFNDNQPSFSPRFHSSEQIFIIRISRSMPSIDSSPLGRASSRDSWFDSCWEQLNFYFLDSIILIVLIISSFSSCVMSSSSYESNCSCKKRIAFVILWSRR